MLRKPYLCLFAAAACCFVIIGTARAESVIFVDRDATGPVHDGTSWCQAYTSLSEAINAAQPGYTIRVANGNYNPDPTGLEDPRDASFALQSGVRIEGGYAGCGAPVPSARDLDLYETILDGDTNDDDIPPIESDCFVKHDTFGCDNEVCEVIVCDLLPECCGSEHPIRRWHPNCVDLARTYCCEAFGRRCDNTRHVVTASSTDDTSILDGVTVTGGYARGENDTNDLVGGGIIIFDGSPTIRDCIVTANLARLGGGGIAIDYGSPTFQACTICQNISYAAGGGVYAAHSSPMFVDCAVTDNETLGSGGGMDFNLQSYPTISGCTLSGNTPGAISASRTVLTVTDTTISNNYGGGAAIDTFFSTLFVRNCAIIGNGATGLTPGIGAMDIFFSGATITSSLIAGNVGKTAGGIFASDSVVTLSQCSIVFNAATISLRGGGVTQSAEATLALDGCILWGNTASGRNNQITQLEYDTQTLDGLTVQYTCLQGWNGFFGGLGNFGDDPLFVDPLGLDGLGGTEDDDYRLLPGSPCINRGDPAFVPTQGETDLDGNPRLQGCRVDLGAYETNIGQLHGDFDDDQDFDLKDFARFQECFRADEGSADWLEQCLCAFDVDDDSVVDLSDYPFLWTELTTP